MKVSYRWLRALIPRLDAAPPEIAERLTRAGLEVEGLHAYGAGLDALLVASVRKVEPHPSRSGLRLVTVDRGGGHEQRIVCGASNVPAAGGLVVLAPLGAELPAVGMTIQAREIAGVKSEGMLCSEAEMGLLAPGATGDDGILVLPEASAEPGTAFLRAMPAASDSIFEIAVSPNRPDALGHVGIARDLAAIFGLPFAFPEPEAPTRVLQGKIEAYASVTVEDFERCPHYGAAVVVDVKIAPSPAWLRYRLSSLGVRPISNVVDVTNLVLFEFGHPIHAFDLDRIRGHAIVVRRARPGERLATLDGVVRVLDGDDLVICDAEGPVALAGVMGGAGSEIAPETRRVLIECAYFAPRGIRRSSRRHGLHTESSHRFERGVDRGDTPDVLAHAASLVVDLAGGAAIPGAIHRFETPPAERTIDLRSSRLDALLGVAVPFSEATDILKRLGFRTKPSDDGSSAKVAIPTFRPDVEREADLIDEVARVRGLDSIPALLPAIVPQPPRDTGRIENAVRQTAIALGMSEGVTYGFVSPSDLEVIGAPPSPVKLENPLSEEQSVMRTSLLPGLLAAVKNAWRKGETEARLFCIGTVFAEGADARGLPRELPRFAALLAGTRRNYLAKPEPFDAYDAKGMAVDLVERITGRKVEVRSQKDRRASHLHPRGAADVLVDAKKVGQLGPLHPDVLRATDIDVAGAVVVELDLDELTGLGEKSPRFSPIPRLPAATRDIALVVHEDVLAGDVERVIREAAGELCESVEVFDVFRGPSLPPEHRSLAFHVVYRDPRSTTAPAEARTLTDPEVDLRHAAVVARAKEELGATLRG